MTLAGEPAGVTLGGPKEPAGRNVLLGGVSAAAVLVVLVAVRIADESYLGDASGIMVALADDLLHGRFYRPLLSDLGYGGTRYFPGHFTLHAVLMLFGLPARAAGHLIGVGAGLGIAWATRRILLDRGASPLVALGLAPLALASRTAVMGLAGIRADILPVALGLAGLAVLGRGVGQTQRRILGAALLFGLALLTKQTLVWAPAGAFFALLATRRFADSARLGAVVAGVVVGGLTIAHLVSGGEMLASFRACAVAGGFSISHFVAALRFLRPGELGWMLGGLVLVASRWKASLADPCLVAFAVCIPETLVLLSAAGIHVNQLVDASCLGAIAVCIGYVSVPPGRLLRLGLPLVAALALLEATLLGGTEMRRGELEAAAAAAPEGDGPIFSEQPWIPMLRGERPYLLDGYNLAALKRTRPEFGRDFGAKMKRCFFRAIFLLDRADSGGMYNANDRMGADLPELVAAYYYFAGVAGAHALYLPRCSGQPPSSKSLLPSGPTVSERFRQPRGPRKWLQELVQ